MRVQKHEKIGVYQEKNECPSCGRWNKVSVRFCKCGQKNLDHDFVPWNSRVYKGLEEKKED